MIFCQQVATIHLKPKNSIPLNNLCLAHQFTVYRGNNCAFYEIPDAAKPIYSVRPKEG